MIWSVLSVHPITSIAVEPHDKFANELDIKSFLGYRAQFTSNLVMCLNTMVTTHLQNLNKICQRSLKYVGVGQISFQYFHSSFDLGSVTDMMFSLIREEKKKQKTCPWYECHALSMGVAMLICESWCSYGSGNAHMGTGVLIRGWRCWIESGS